MKNKIILIVTIIFVALTACNDLDLSPLSEGSSENWYSNQTEIEMAVNDLYKSVFWPEDSETFTDNWTSRNTLSTVTEGNVNGEWNTAENLWKNSYKAISRTNTILASLERAADQVAPEILNRFEAEARFARAGMYSLLTSKFGDVVFNTTTLDLEEAFQTGRTDKATVLQTIYEDYDFAAQYLPADYGNDTKRASKGAALGMKARIAMYNSDWSVARTAAQECMTLGYTLYPDYGELFLSRTKNPDEVLFSMPRSIELDVQVGNVKNVISRNAGGWGAHNPSWDLLASYLCTDGLPVDESAVFDPKDPFKNRDPRCNATIVPFQTEHLGYMYQPHPDSLQVLNFTTGKYQFNNDTRSNKQFASYNALLWKKSVDSDWSDDKKADPDRFILRYADVLLMYAEASIELGQIDQSVLDAINMVRARAYGVDKEDTGAYPAITTTAQNELRKIVRIERRMEFAWEGLRYMDLIRWNLAEKALTTTIYGMLDPADLREKVVNPGLWFWPEVPPVDEDGIPDFTSMDNAGLIKTLAIRKFDARQYLWPIPTKEILINENLSQNPGY